MNRSRMAGLGALGLMLAVAACNASAGSGDSEGPAAIQGVDGIELPERQERAAGHADNEVLEVIDVAAGIQRQVTRQSAEPTAELATRAGTYVAIWVSDDGTSSVFEGVPAGAQSALKGVHADSPTELFQALAAEGLEAPAALSKGRRFSVLEAETAARLAALPPEELAFVDDAEGAPRAPQQQAMLATSCAKVQANDFYDGYRPGALDDSEGVLEYSASGYQYREAARRKDYQAFFQTNFDQWTPQQPPGGLQAAYFRAAATVCTGTARLTLWRCYGDQDTADNGCGESGSNVAVEKGPFVIGAGGVGIYKDWPGGDIGRARLDQMDSSADHAIWSVMSSNSGYAVVNNCYN